jgi:plastocyanin
MRGRLALACAVAATVAFMPGSGHADRPACNRTKDVTVGDDPQTGNLFFSKSKVTIRAGSCVRWTWTGDLDHQLEGRNLNSPVRSAPYRFKKRYPRARKRSFRVICTIHPLSMRMRVKVLPPRSS